MSKVWLVTGASRGLGREIARAALEAGDTVMATARSGDDVRNSLEGGHDRLHTCALDITDADAARAVAAETVERLGAIDVLVNNAGYAELGFFETITDAAVRRQFEVNLFGTMNVARAVAPHMRKRRSGLVVTISSVSGLVSNAGGAVYSASKFAIEGWMEGFSQELAPLGVRSLLVEPGMLHRVHGPELCALRHPRHSGLRRGRRAVSRVRGRCQRSSAGRPEAPGCTDRRTCVAG